MLTISHNISNVDDNSVVTWGRNDYGQLGRLTEAEDDAQKEDASEDNAERSTSKNSCVPEEVPLLKNCTQVRQIFICKRRHLF